jgi:hypothetical protein
MKEFVEKTGLPYTAINVDEDAAGAAKLKDKGMRVPAMCIGDECVNGVHLETVAKVLGVPYEPPVMLEPAALVEKYRVVTDALCRYIAQVTPEAASFKLPKRDRDLIQVAGHAGMVMRYFLGKYEDEAYDRFFDDLEPGLRDPAELIEYVRETRARFETWWEQDGSFDPLDTVITVYWGPRTLHEALEREVWHTAQHTRQVMLMLESVGITPDTPLTADDLAGLPLPDRVFD